MTDGPVSGVATPLGANRLTASRRQSEALDLEIKSFDFGSVVGVSLERSRLILDARYTLGLTNFATTAGEEAKIASSR